MLLVRYWNGNATEWLRVPGSAAGVWKGVWGRLCGSRGKEPELPAVPDAAQFQVHLVCRARGGILSVRLCWAEATALPRCVALAESLSDGRGRPSRAARLRCRCSVRLPGLAAPSRFGGWALLERGFQIYAERNI